MVGDLNQSLTDFAAATKAKESVESELRHARQIQESLLPRVFPPFPDRTEFDLYAKNAPAKDVAGDFYDFFFLDEDHLAVLIADVSGKGVPAALFMAVNRTLMKTVCRKGVGPAESLRAANEILSRDNDACMFTTMFLAVFNVRTGGLTYANAGHNPPVIVSRDRTLRTLESMGDVFLGVETGVSYHEGRTRLEPGDLLMLYTDGVTEAAAPDGSFFGEERLAGFMAERRDDALSAIWGRLRPTWTNFRKAANSTTSPSFCSGGTNRRLPVRGEGKQDHGRGIHQNASQQLRGFHRPGQPGSEDLRDPFAPAAIRRQNHPVHLG